jgi:hypothetical protein
MSQQTGQENEGRKHTAKEWDNVKPEITRLYESGTLENVIKSMAEQHGFNATYEITNPSKVVADLLVVQNSIRIDLGNGV